MEKYEVPSGFIPRKKGELKGISISDGETEDLRAKGERC